MIKANCCYFRVRRASDSTPARLDFEPRETCSTPRPWPRPGGPVSGLTGRPAGDRGDHTEHQVDRAGQIALPGEDPRPLVQPDTERPRRECVGHVADHA